MDNKKKSFVLYHDTLDVLDMLSDEQAGKLFKAIKDYQTGTEPELDALLSIVFLPFKKQFIRDGVKYENTVERNKENGKKGGRPKKTQDNPKNPVGYLETQGKPNEPRKADSDSDSDSVNDNDSVNDSVNVNDIDDDTLINTVSTIIGTIACKSDIKDIKGKILFQNGNLDDKINSITGYYVDTFGKTSMSLQDIKNNLKQLQLN